MFCKPCSVDLCDIHNVLFMQGSPLLLKRIHNTPSYTLIPIPETITINPDETVYFAIFISGMGNIKNNKIRVFFPKNLLNSENPGIIGTSLNCVNFIDVYTNLSTHLPHNLVQNNTLSNIAIDLVDCNFMHSKTFGEYEAPIIMSERENDGLPPIYIVMNVADKHNVTFGDHAVPLIFTYTDGIKWYQDEKILTIHVNNPVEENRQILTILSTAVAIILTCISLDEKFKKLLSFWIGRFILLSLGILIAYIIHYVLISI
jgi:hypothetical protein